jgi:Tol biopolymer transport system component
VYSGGRVPGAPPGSNARIEHPEISVVGPDGRGERRVTRDPQEHGRPPARDEETDPLWLDDRRLFYVRLANPPDPAASRSLDVIPARGGRPRTVTRLNYALPAVSPDGRRVALAGSTAEAPRLRLYLLDLESGRLRTLVEENVVPAPSWSPDARLIAFALGDRVEAIRPDGGGRRTVVRLPGKEIREVAWSPDGRRIAFTTAPTRRVPTPPSP